jgi:hypothetical protein
MSGAALGKSRSKRTQAIRFHAERMTALPQEIDELISYGQWRDAVTKATDSHGHTSLKRERRTRASVANRFGLVSNRAPLA